MPSRFSDLRKALIKWSADGDTDTARAVQTMNWCLVDATLSVLEPFYEVVAQLEGEMYVALSLVFPLLNTIQEALANLANDAATAEKFIDWSSAPATPIETTEVASAVEEFQRLSRRGGGMRAELL